MKPVESSKRLICSDVRGFLSWGRELGRFFISWGRKLDVVVVFFFLGGGGGGGWKLHYIMGKAWGERSWEASPAPPPPLPPPLGLIPGCDQICVVFSAL